MRTMARMTFNIEPGLNNYAASTLKAASMIVDRHAEIVKRPTSRKIVMQSIESQKARERYKEVASRPGADARSVPSGHTASIREYQEMGLPRAVRPRAGELRATQTENQGALYKPEWRPPLGAHSENAH